MQNEIKQAVEKEAVAEISTGIVQGLKDFITFLVSCCKKEEEDLLKPKTVTVAAVSKPTLAVAS